MGYWEMTDAQRRSFMGRMFRFVSVETPIDLYSFSATQDRPRKPDRARPGKFEPMYFLSKSNLLEAIGNSAPQHSVFDQVRAGVALCEDWGNDLKYLFILSVPAHLQVEAWVGLTKFQNRGGSSDEALPGGWLQYLIDIDLRLEHYLNGPIRTGR